MTEFMDIHVGTRFERPKIHVEDPSLGPDLDLIIITVLEASHG